MRLIGYGHPEVRGTHPKTLELAAHQSITGRATCVIGVGTRLAADDATAAGTETAVAPVAGPVRIEIRVGSRSVTLHANGNANWTPAGSAVIRRSGLRLPGTLATEADAAAADLPEDLIAALRLPSTAVELSVQAAERRADGRAGLALLWTEHGPPPTPRLLAEIAAAALVVAEDQGARRLLAGAAMPAGTVVAAPGDQARIAAVVADRRRLLVLATEGLPGAATAELLDRPETVAVEVGGLPPLLAVAAASPSRGPLFVAPRRAGDLRRLLRMTGAAQRVAVEVEAAELPKLLGLAAELRGRADAVLMQPYGSPLRVRSAEPAGLPASGTVLCCLDAVVATGSADDGSADDGPAVFDPAVRGMVQALLTDGVSTRTAARAVAELTGWPRRRCYAAVLALSGGVAPKPERE